MEVIRRIIDVILNINKQFSKTHGTTMPTKATYEENLRVAYDELENRGFDAGGGEILYYKGQPFTGTIVEKYDNGIAILTEEEFTDGHLGGAQRQYHENGQMEEEYFIAFNTLYGFRRDWDEQGNLISQHDFGPKPVWNGHKFIKPEETIRVTYEELDNRGFDAGGGEILYYKGQPFTGTIVEYRNDVLICEEEFTDGHLGGAQRTYHANGQIEKEYFIAFNTHYGLLRWWDEEGNLTHQRDFGPKPVWNGHEFIKPEESHRSDP